MIDKQHFLLSNHGAIYIRSTQCTAEGQQTQADYVDDVGPRQAADLAEARDWVEGLRTAGHNARQRGNSALAEALDIVRFEVYESYLDEEYTNNTAKRLKIKS